MWGDRKEIDLMGVALGKGMGLRESRFLLQDQLLPLIKSESFVSQFSIFHP